MKWVGLLLGVLTTQKNNKRHNGHKGTLGSVRYINYLDWVMESRVCLCPNSSNCAIKYMAFFAYQLCLKSCLKNVENVCPVKQVEGGRELGEGSQPGRTRPVLLCGVPRVMGGCGNLWRALSAKSRGQISLLGPTRATLGLECWE